MRIQTDLLRGLFRKFRTQSPTIGAELRENIQPVSTVDMATDELADFEQWNRGPAGSTLPRMGVTWRSWDISGATVIAGTIYAAITLTRGLWLARIWLATTDAGNNIRGQINLVEGGAVTMGLNIANPTFAVGVQRYDVICCAETTGVILRVESVDAGVSGRHIGGMQAWRTWTDDRAF